MKKLFTISLIALFLINFYDVNASTPRKEYVKRYKDIAIQEMQKTGIPASIKLAQGILESGNGNSDLAKTANNHFGIKCHDWTGRTYKMDDDRKNECFRKYNNPEQSWIDHSKFLTSRSRYQGLFSLKPTDYKGWAHGLKSAGYATNPKYADLLIKIIEDEKLYRYDQIASNHTGSSNKTSLWDKLFDKDQAQQQVGAKRVYKSLEQMINGVPCIIIEDGDSYNSIANYYNTTVEKLMEYNEKHDTKVKKGDIVYLNYKKARAARGYDFHRVVAGDDLHSISQRYGVKAAKLIIYNYFTADSKLIVGQKVYLRGKAILY